jgi:major intracellular serine protease
MAKEMGRLMKKLVIVAALLIAVGAFASRPKRTIVAVIDTGIRMSPELEGKLCGIYIDTTGHGIYDYDGHGTNVASIIARQIDGSKYCILPIKFYHDHNHIASLDIGINEAIRYNAKYINISAGGGLALKEEHNALKKALRRGITIAVAAGNDGRNLEEFCYYYPACYTDLRKFTSWYVVSNVHDGKLANGSNYGYPVNATGDGYMISAGGSTESGTSQATAQFLGHLIGEQ